MTVICQLAIDDLKNGMKGAQNVSDREALGYSSFSNTFPLLPAHFYLLGILLSLPRNKSWATQLSEADTDPSDQFFQLGAQAEPPTFEEPVTVSPYFLSALEETIN